MAKGAFFGEAVLKSAKLTGAKLRHATFTEADLAHGGSDRFIDAMVLWGDPATIKRGLRAHLEAGATQVCIQPVHAEGDTETRDRTLEALADL